MHFYVVTPTLELLLQWIDYHAIKQANGVLTKNSRKLLWSVLKRFLSEFLLTNGKQVFTLS